jgi:hypothetical protein
MRRRHRIVIADPGQRSAVGEVTGGPSELDTVLPVDRW